MEVDADGVPASGANGVVVTTTGTPTANEENREYARRNGYTKAVETIDSLNAAASTSQAGQNGMEVDGAPVAKKAKQSKAKQPTSMPLDDFTKRNGPTASADTASTNGDQMTPAFIAQAEEVVNRQKRDAAASNGGQLGVNVDSDDRVRGYVQLREWVERALSGWKVSGRSVYSQRHGTD